MPDAASTDRLVREAAPDALLRLAAQSSAAESLPDPETTLQV
jgi:GDP-D-mannose dehydratase